MSNLPTPTEMFRGANVEVSKAEQAVKAAGEWLRSDWHPVGSSLTDEQSDARVKAWKAIDEALSKIYDLQNVLRPVAWPEG